MNMPKSCFKSFDAGMRQRKTITKAGGAQSFTGLQGIENRPRIEIEEGGGARCEILKQLLFVAGAGGKNHPVRFDKVGEIHGYTFARAFS